VSLAPLIDPAIRGVEGKRHEVSQHCCVPGCISLSQHGHHMWARSFLRGQPTEWVALPSGRIVSNVVGLCIRHHNQVTGDVGGHQAMIRCEPDESFIWLTAQDGGWINEGALNPQPYFQQEEEKPKTRKQAHLHLDPGQTCGSCGYTAPRKRPSASPKRKTREWNVKVPDDAEIGADVLDEWIEGIARKTGLEGDISIGLLRYHALCLAMAWHLANEEMFIADLVEAAQA
jgi:hypothetical protein